MTKESRFLEAIEEHRGILFKVAKLYFRSPDDQDDLIQETLCQLWRSFDSFGGQSKFSSWMYRVALNTAIVFVRKESKRSREISTGTPNAVQPESKPNLKSELEIFYGAIEELTRIEKAIILMRIEGFDHRQIAETLGIQEGNARVKLNRAKAKLQSIIKTQES